MYLIIEQRTIASQLLRIGYKTYKLRIDSSALKTPTRCSLSLIDWVLALLNTNNNASALSPMNCFSLGGLSLEFCLDRVRS
jgi:hypothetical protein